MQKEFQEQFLDELLVDAWFEATDDLALLKEDLRPLLQERIMITIYEELTEEGSEIVTKFLEDDNIEELDAYLRKNIPNFDDFLMEIYTQFEDEYLENMKSEDTEKE